MRAGFGSDEVVAAFGARPAAVIHSFSGPVDYARDMLALGLAVSFSGLVFRHGEAASADVVRLVPTERLLVETDSPYLSPPGAPRARNEPEGGGRTAGWAAAQRAIGEPDADRGGEPGLDDALVLTYEAIFGVR